MLSLILALPQAAIGGERRLQRQIQRQQRNRQHATAERQQGQQQQRRQQPVAVVQRRSALFALCSRSVDAIGLQHTQRTQVVVAGPDRGVFAAARAGHLAQPVGVQPRRGDTAFRVAIRSARRRTHAQHRNAISVAARVDRSGGRPASGTTGDQQNVAAPEACTLEQPRRLLDRAIRAVAVARHHVRRQRIQEQRDVVGVIGQRRHGVGVLGEGHQRDLPAAARAQDLRDLGAGLQQSGRLYVRGQACVGQIHRDHQRIAVLPQRLRQRAPARPGQRQQHQHGRDHAGHRRQGAAPTAATGLRALQQMRQQMRVHRFAPHIAAQAPVPQPPHQQRNRQQPQQPQRAQEPEPGRDRAQDLGVERVGVHRSTSRRCHSASSAHSSAAASGHG